MHQLQLQPSAAYATLSWARMFDVMKQYCLLYSQPAGDQVRPTLQHTQVADCVQLLHDRCGCIECPCSTQRHMVKTQAKAIN